MKRRRRIHEQGMLGADEEAERRQDRQDGGVNTEHRFLIPRHTHHNKEVPKILKPNIPIASQIKKSAQGIKYSYRYLNRLSPNVLIFIYYSLLYDIVTNLYKPFATKFLQRMGGNEFHISLYNSLPGLVAVFAILPGSFFVMRFANKKKIIAIFFAISRTFMLFLVAIPFFPAQLRPFMFVGIISLMNFPDAISQSSFQSFLGTVLDGRTRATAISLRNKFGQVAVLLITLITGVIITFVSRTDAQRVIVYQIFFALAFVFGVIEILTFLKFKAAPDVKQSAVTEQKAYGLGAAIKDRRFMRFLLLTITFYVTWQAGWPLCSIVLVMDLGANEMWLAIYAVISGIAAFVAAGYWNKLIQRKGNDTAMVFAVIAIAINALSIALAPNRLALGFIYFINGVSSIGVSMTLLNGLLEATPNENRIVYIGIYNTFVNISLAVSPFIALALFNAAGSRWALSIVAAGRLTVGIFMALVFMYSHRKKS